MWTAFRKRVPPPSGYLISFVVFVSGMGCSVAAGEVHARQGAPAAAAFGGEITAALSPGLSIVAEVGVHPSGPNRAAISFGAVGLLDRTAVEHTFTLRNTTAHPLTIRRIQAACGCTSAVLAKRRPGDAGDAIAPSVPANGRLPTTLGPGEEVALRVALDLRPLPPGTIRKSVSVYLDDSAIPTAVVEVRGTLLPSVSFEPSIADLGRTAPEKGQTLTLTATFDPRVLAAVPEPILTSSNPSVRVTPVPDRAEDAPSVRRYRVELAAEAPLGPLSGVLAFRTHPPVSGGQNHRPAALEAATASIDVALQSGRVPLTGYVMGAVSATPQTLAMGMVTRGQEATRTVTLTGKTAADLTDLRVESGTPWVTGEFGDTGTDAAGAATRLLRVKLAADAPAGGFSSNIVVVLRSGRRLLIPTSAFVRTP